MKKFFVRDADGEEYEVEEIKECHDDDVIEEVSETEEQPEALTNEEIAALKRLAAVADRLLSTVKAEDEDPETLDDEDEEKDIGDEEVTEEKKEEVVDTTKTRDSRKSFGAIEKRKATVDDSLNTDIDDAWAKRYGGRN
jgi:hypothetical protein